MDDQHIAASLTPTQRFLLEWLSKAETSALGECKGSNLDRLIEMGLAWVAPIADGADRDYARVSLTVAGLAALTNIPPAPGG